MTLKVGGFYRTREGQDLVHIEMFIRFIKYGYRGHIVSPINSQLIALSWTQVTLSWTQDGKYGIKDGHDYLDLVEEITDPVILAFYDT